LRPSRPLATHKSPTSGDALIVCCFRPLVTSLLTCLEHPY
jgi:hypothetical protein